MRRGALLPVLWLAAACAPPVPDTPRAALRAFRQAMVEGDVGALHACTTGTPAEFRALDARLRLSLAVRRFRDALEAEHGPEAWDRLNDEAAATFGDEIGSAAPLESVAIEVDGPRARCHWPGGSIRLRHDGDGWRVRIADVLGGVHDPVRAELFFDGCADLLDATRKTIGGPGVTPTSLDVDLGLGIARLRRRAESLDPDTVPDR